MRARYLIPTLTAAALLGCTPTAEWSIGSGELSFTSVREGEGDIFIKFWRGEGDSTAQRLTAGETGNHWATWSHDGTRIVFQSQRDGNREIYVMASDGAGVTNLTNDEAEDLLPDWSPVEDRIAFFSTRGHDRGPNGEFVGNIYVMDADGSNVTKVTNQPLSSSFAPTWSPDGTELLISRRYDGNTELVRLSLESGAEVRLTTSPMAEGGGVYSPDGMQIAFSAEDEDASRLMVMQSDGSGIRTLVDSGRNYYPSWSPDGEWISFTALSPDGEQYDIWAMRADGTEGPVAIVATRSDERKSAWRPMR